MYRGDSDFSFVADKSLVEADNSRLREAIRFLSSKRELATAEAERSTPEIPDGVHGLRLAAAFTDDYKCLQCGKEGTRHDILRCSCREASYCCTACQRKDWPRHKLQCMLKNPK